MSLSGKTEPTITSQDAIPILSATEYLFIENNITQYTTLRYTI